MRRSFPRQVASLAGIFAFVREFLSREGLGDESAADLDLVLEELFTNLVRHGRGGAPGGPIQGMGQAGSGDVELALERAPEGLVAELVERDAEPFDPTAWPEPDTRQPLASRGAGGLGVHLVRQLTRSFTYEYRERVGVTRVTLRSPR